MIKYFPDSSGALIAEDGTARAFSAGITTKDLVARQAQFMIDTAPPAAPVMIDLSSILALQQQLDSLQTEVTKMQPIAPVPPAA
jgi:hypothetical protein